MENAVRQYLEEILGLPVRQGGTWSGARTLPYYLQQAFHFSELEINGKPVVLARGKGDDRHPLGDTRKWLDIVQTYTEQPVIYVIDTLASHERRRLIEYKMPFVVPGNQLYLPDFGLDLREYFRRPAPVVETGLSPSTQALLITALLQHPWDGEWQPAAMGRALGYTTMTSSRAAKELTAAGLSTPFSVERTRWLRMTFTRQETWERAGPLMRTPVRRKVWVLDHGSAIDPPRLAGLTALARHSMLAEPMRPVYAVAATAWKAMVGAGVRELPEPMDGAHEWQLWNYSPALVPQQDTVDPLSLILSLQDDEDDRVLIALDQLRKQLPWLKV
nr:hypothetical protein [Bordetella sp. LUAb4]